MPAVPAETNPNSHRQWLAAVAEGYVHLEMEILRRFREGDFKTADAGAIDDFANARSPARGAPGYHRQVRRS